MLTESELARRLRAAMDWREPRIPSALVAKRCGVTPQAVSKWRRDGKIDLREHLSTLSEVTQVPLMFYIEPEPGQSKETQRAWQRLSEWLSKAAMVAFIFFLALPPKYAYALDFFEPGSRLCIMLNRLRDWFWLPLKIKFS